MNVVEQLNYEHGQLTLLVVTAFILLLIFLDNRGVLTDVLDIATGRDTTSGGGTSFGAKPESNTPVNTGEVGGTSGASPVSGGSVSPLPPFTVNPILHIAQ